MRENDLESGEIGVLVHDDFQGKGLGYKLVGTSIGIVKEEGIEELRGVALTENTRTLQMVREFDFTKKYLSLKSLLSGSPICNPRSAYCHIAYQR
jgi:GNAT superfamily N-acetyltransferase